MPITPDLTINLGENFTVWAIFYKADGTPGVPDGPIIWHYNGYHFFLLDDYENGSARFKGQRVGQGSVVAKAPVNTPQGPVIISSDGYYVKVNEPTDGAPPPQPAPVPGPIATIRVTGQKTP